MRKTKWYQEKTFKFMSFGLNGLGLLLSVGITIVDKQLSMHWVYISLFWLLIAVPLTYFFRANP